MKSDLITDINICINKGVGSYTEIADYLTKKLKREVTKNAVSGAVYRSRQRGNIVKATIKPERAKLNAGIIAAAHRLVNEPLGVQLIELKGNQCHYPFGDPRKAGFHYCGGHVHKRSYCLEHYKACYQPMKERK